MRAVLLASFAIPILAAEDWVAMGAGAGVHLDGKTVTVEYKIARGQFAMAVMPNPTLAGMKRLPFRLKTDVATPVGIMLSETKPGGDYNAVVWSPRDQWQQIELAPDDFQINDGPNDPKDPNGRLDLDQVQAIAVLDLGQFMTMAADNPKVPIVITRLSGDHKLQIEDFRIVADGEQASARTVVIDDFQRDFLTWMTPGGAELALSKSGNPLNRRALAMSYEQKPASLVVVLHRLGAIRLHDTKALSLDIASTRDAQVMISLEQEKVGGRDGPRYNYPIDVLGGRVARHETIPFRSFTLAGESAAASELDLSKVRAISLVDVSAAVSGETARNILWVANLKAQ